MTRARTWVCESQPWVGSVSSGCCFACSVANDNSSAVGGSSGSAGAATCARGALKPRPAIAPTWRPRAADDDCGTSRDWDWKAANPATARSVTTAHMAAWTGRCARHRLLTPPAEARRPPASVQVGRYLRQLTDYQVLPGTVPRRGKREPVTNSPNRPRGHRTVTRL